MDLYAEVFDLATQQLTAAFVELNGHQAWSKFNNVGFKARFFQCVSGFQTQQATTNNHTGFADLGRCFDVLKVFNGAVHQAVILVFTRDWRHKRKRTGSQNQFVVTLFTTTGGGDGFCVGVNLNHFFV